MSESECIPLISLLPLASFSPQETALKPPNAAPKEIRSIQASCSNTVRDGKLITATSQMMVQGKLIAVGLCFIEMLRFDDMFSVILNVMYQPTSDSDCSFAFSPQKKKIFRDNQRLRVCYGHTLHTLQ